MLEEWRLGRGAAVRLFDKQARCCFHGSKYAERLPIGKPEIIKTARRATRSCASTRTGTAPT